MISLKDLTTVKSHSKMALRYLRYLGITVVGVQS